MPHWVKICFRCAGLSSSFSRRRRIWTSTVRISLRYSKDPYGVQQHLSGIHPVGIAHEKFHRLSVFYRHCGLARRRIARIRAVSSRIMISERLGSSASSTASRPSLGHIIITLIFQIKPNLPLPTTPHRQLLRSSYSYPTFAYFMISSNLFCPIPSTLDSSSRD